MALSNIATTNTFTEQMVRLNQVIFELNKYIDGQAISQGNITVTGAVAGGEMLMNVVGNTKSTRVFVGDGSLALPAITRALGANVGIYFPSDNTMAFVSSSNAILTIASSGNTGIGVTTPSAKLDVEGTFRANGVSYFGSNVGINKAAPSRALDVVGDIWATGDITMESDARTKDEIVPIASALDKVMAMQGVSYIKRDTGKPQMGLIAQELQKIMPSAVSTQSDGTLGVNYQSLIAVLIEAVKELKGK